MWRPAAGTTCLHSVAVLAVLTRLTKGLASADRLRLAAEKGKSNFAHPLGVKPKHRKIVRTFGQVLLVLCRFALSVS